MAKIECANDKRSESGESMYYLWYYRSVTMLWSIIVSASLGIAISILYYLLRPSAKDSFSSWFHRGKYVLILQFFGTVYCAINVFAIAGWLFNGWYFFGEDQICMNGGLGWIAGNVPILTVGYVALGGFTIISLLLMF
jgi:hypothetical protein